MVVLAREAPAAGELLDTDLPSLPVADAEIRLGGKGKLGTKPYTLLANGTPYELEARKAVNTDLIVSALEQAKSGLRAA